MLRVHLLPCIFSTEVQTYIVKLSMELSNELIMRTNIYNDGKICG